MKQKRFLLGLALAALALCPASAQSPSSSSSVPYPSADLATRKVLVECDGFIAQRKYLSAYNALAPAANDTDLVIAKRIELCLNYFVQSINHMMFAFADLKPGQDLMKLREGGGKYTLVAYDPPKVVEEYCKTKPRSALLEKSLGDYYFEVRMRYAGRWTESDEEVCRKSVARYEAAFGMGLEDALALANCAEACLQLGDNGKAVAYYDRSFALGMDSANARFNAALAFLGLERYDRAIAEAKRAAELYEGQPDYRFDAVLLAGDASRDMGDLDGAIALFAEAQKIEARDYRLYQKRLYAYLAKPDEAAALGDARSLFGIAPRNPAATQMVMAAYQDSEKAQWLEAFFEWGLKAYAADPEAQGNILYHYSSWAHDAGDDARALSLLERAEAAFRKSGTTNAQVFEAIAAQREAFGK
jgi:tetratricopeptide (TPR) repeat protein